MIFGAGGSVVHVVVPYLLEEGVVQIIWASRQTWQRHRLGGDGVVRDPPLRQA